MTTKLNSFFLLGIVGLLSAWLVACGANVTPSVTVPPIKETVIVPATPMPISTPSPLIENVIYQITTTFGASTIITLEKGMPFFITHYGSLGDLLEDFDHVLYRSNSLGIQVANDTYVTVPYNRIRELIRDKDLFTVVLDDGRQFKGKLNDNRYVRLDGEYRILDIAQLKILAIPTSESTPTSLSPRWKAIPPNEVNAPDGFDVSRIASIELIPGVCDNRDLVDSFGDFYLKTADNITSAVRMKDFGNITIEKISESKGMQGVKITGKPLIGGNEIIGTIVGADNTYSSELLGESCEVIGIWILGTDGIGMASTKIDFSFEQLQP
jgi:hypothetical protein